MQANAVHHRVTRSGVCPKAVPEMAHGTRATRRRWAGCGASPVGYVGKDQRKPVRL